MQSNRRSLLIGLITLTVVGGAVFGTGAFSTVEADRDVTVNTAGDSAGLIEISVNETYNGIENDATTTGANDETIVNISLVDINDDAVTTFNDSLEITNNGANPVTISVDSNADGVTVTDVPDTTLNTGDSINATIEVNTTVSTSDGSITITANSA